MLEIKIINNIPKFEDLVGYFFKFENKNIRIYEYNSNNGNLKLAIDINNNGVDEITEEISLSLGLDRFLKTLKDNYGLEILLINGFNYTQDTIQKAQGLIQAGFVKLIKSENNYIVDNIFQQTFLLENELQYLLNNNILEINLSEIK